MTPEERQEIRDWMAVPENIGALHRALLDTPAVPVTEFDPFGMPPPFAGRLEMIGMGKSRLEDAYEAAIDALEGYPLFTMTQVQKLICHFGSYTGGGDGDRARHIVAKQAYRLRGRDEPNNRIKYRKRQEVIYARTKRTAALVQGRHADDHRRARSGRGAGGASGQRRTWCVRRSYAGGVIEPSEPSVSGPCTGVRRRLPNAY